MPTATASPKRQVASNQMVRGSLLGVRSVKKTPEGRREQILEKENDVDSPPYEFTVGG